MRAAKAVKQQRLMFNRLQEEKWAELIDRETGLPEVRDALRALTNAINPLLTELRNTQDAHNF